MYHLEQYIFNNVINPIPQNITDLCTSMHIGLLCIKCIYAIVFTHVRTYARLDTVLVVRHYFYSCYLAPLHQNFAFTGLEYLDNSVQKSS